MPSDGVPSFRWTGSPTHPPKSFELVIDAETADKAIVLRATDTMNNVATARANTPAPVTAPAK